jgi:zinc D-Ala-D-Ala carboxypeptidase
MQRKHVFRGTAAGVLAATIAVTGASMAQARVGAPYLYVGGPTGNGVKCVQFEINYHYGVNIAVDGVFGPVTKSYVQRIQAENRLVQDGVVGPKTGDPIYNGLVIAAHNGHPQNFNCYYNLPTSN